MKRSGIYKIQSLSHPERCYIGSAVDLKVRKGVHFCALRKGEHHSSKLQLHYNKYGKEDLLFSLIEPCLPIGLLQREQEYLDKLKPYFNICKIAGNTLGRVHSDETKRKISRAKAGKKMPAKTMEARRNLSIALTGRIFSEEHKNKLRIVNKGNTHSLGHRHTNETKQKISITRIAKYGKPFKAKRENVKGSNNPMFGKRHTEASKLKNRLSHLGKPLSLETRMKLSAMRKGRVFSEEHKKNLGIAIHEAWLRKKQSLDQIKKTA
jgi:group I intron endonuclease